MRFAHTAHTHTHTRQNDSAFIFIFLIWFGLILFRSLSPSQSFSLDVVAVVVVAAGVIVAALFFVLQSIQRIKSSFNANNFNNHEVWAHFFFFKLNFKLFRLSKHCCIVYVCYGYGFKHKDIHWSEEKLPARIIIKFHAFACIWIFRSAYTHTRTHSIDFLYHFAKASLHSMAWKEFRLFACG